MHRHTAAHIHMAGRAEHIMSAALVLDRSIKMKRMRCVVTCEWIVRLCLVLMVMLCAQSVTCREFVQLKGQRSRVKITRKFNIVHVTG